MGILTVIFPFIVRETYAPILLERKAARLRKDTGNPNLKSRLDRQLTQKKLIFDTLIRPPRILFTSPIVSVLAIDTAIVYGYQYLVFTTLSYIFQDKYRLSTGLSGLVYLGNGIGTILGIPFPQNFSETDQSFLTEYTRNLYHRLRIRQSHGAKKEKGY